MIKEKKMFTIICDSCGKDANDGGEFSCWSDVQSAKYMAEENDWVEINNNHYCPDCIEQVIGEKKGLMENF